MERIQLNQDNGTIEDEAIPCKADKEAAGNRKRKTESDDCCQHRSYKQGDEPSWLTASGCERGPSNLSIRTQ